MFQWLYNLFRKMRYPTWLRPYVQELNDLMLTILKEAGQAYLNYLKGKIIESAQNKSLSVKEKFNYVFEQAKIGFKTYAVELKDNEINTLINYLVSSLKKQKVIL